MAAPKSKASFEQLFTELEEKVARLEQGGLSLDDSLSAYEEAVALAQRCQALLDGAELRITKLRAAVTTNGALEPSDDLDSEAVEEEV
jgi:exodeoxyribonuclease VII small subunit